MSDVKRYVVTIDAPAQTLTEINELNNHLTRAGFTLTLSDDAGHVHDLGTNSFGLVSPHTAEEIKALAAGLAETALDVPAEVKVKVTTFEEWLK